jgi:oxygen-independent coproporphyrinogen-3 oxidase
MIFFPGEKFPENFENTPELPSADVTVVTHSGAVTAVVRLKTESSFAVSCYTLKGEKLKQAGDMAEKIAVGNAFINAGSAVCGITPPWGMLTGVRPAKVASAMMDSGLTPAETAKRIRGLYKVNAQKTALAVKVSLVEHQLITEKSQKECSVYVAIPFCPSRCSYCSFVSYTSEKLLRLIPEYLVRLAEDIRYTGELVRSLGVRVSTVYIGGGTPTVLDVEQLRFLLSVIGDSFDVNELDEFTLEAGRPDTITRDKLDAAKAGGVSRISVNTQTLNEDILSSIGRRHSAAQFFDAYRLAAESDFRDINVDLIAGLPGESASSFSSAVERIADLHPTNVTVHTFCVKKSAQIRSDDHGIYRREGSEASRAVDSSQNILELTGYLPYYMYRQKNTVGNLENVGYAVPGHEGLYNIYMMEEVHSIFAVGASAVTKLVRRNTDGLYIERIFENKYPYEYLRERSDGTYSDIRAENEKKIREFYGSF